MAYAPFNSSSPNPPVLLSAQPIAFGSSNAVARGGKLWAYDSTHLQTNVGTSDFISDGQALGMAPGDCLIAVSQSSAVSFHRVLAVGSTYTGFSAGLVISSAS